ncbi:MAG: hypothetical protein HN970_08670 [Rhodospirillaceae bacterium]|nr:hypothetical protein [Rhodospirillaceae bacterium]
MSEHKFGQNSGRITSQILGIEPQRKSFGGGTVYFPDGDRPANRASLPVPKFGAGRIVVQRPHALPFDQAVAGGGGTADTPGDTPDFAGVQDGIAFANEQASAAEYDAERALSQPAPGAPASGLAERHLEALGKRRDAALAEAPDGFAAERTRALFDEVMQRQGARAIGAEHQARQLERIQGTETALGRVRERALGDPNNLEAHIDEGRALLGRMVETGLSGAGAAGRAESFEDDLRRSVLETLAKGDPWRALESLDTGVFDGLIEDDEGKARIRDGLALWSDKQEVCAEERRQAEQDAQRRRFADTLAQEFNNGNADNVHIDLALASGTIDAAGADDLRGRLGDIEAHNGDLDGIGRFILGGDLDPGFAIDGNDQGVFVGPDKPLPEETILPNIIDPNEALPEATLLPHIIDPNAPLPGETLRPEYVNPDKIDNWWQREMERRNRFPGLTTLEDNQSPEVLQEIPAELLIQTVERTGHVPTPVTDGLRAAILAGGAAEKVAAGKQIAGLQKTAPEVAEFLIGKLPPEEARQITVIAGIAELPLLPERIDAITQERIEKLPTASTIPSAPAVQADDDGLGDEIEGLGGGTQPSGGEALSPSAPSEPDDDGDFGDEFEGLGGGSETPPEMPQASGENPASSEVAQLTRTDVDLGFELKEPTTTITSSGVTHTVTGTVISNSGPAANTFNIDVTVIEGPNGNTSTSVIEESDLSGSSDGASLHILQNPDGSGSVSITDADGNVKVTDFDANDIGGKGKSPAQNVIDDFLNGKTGFNI